MSLSLEFEIKLRADYHVGAGGGLGALVDSVLLRDGDGVPALRGTVLAGLLRDGLWRLLQLPPLADLRLCKASRRKTAPSHAPATDEVESDEVPDYCGAFGQGTSECPICRLFGSPRTPKRWHISSARPDGLEKPADGGQWQAGVTGAQVVQRARISPRTRRAEARKLFAQEHGDARFSFRFRAECAVDDEAAWDEAALLVVAARNVRELGRGRRRGQGECRWHLIAGADEEQLLARFAQRWLGKQVAARSLATTTAPAAQIAAAGNAAHTWRMRLFVRADEPLTIARRGSAGNQFETLENISGAALRGACAALAARRARLNEAADYADFVALFLREQVHFSFLHPAELRIESLDPAIPAPLDLLTCKIFSGLQVTTHEHGARGFTTLPKDETRVCDQCQRPEEPTKLQPLGDWVTIKTKPRRLEVGARSELHIRIDPESQRAATGDLFGYSALETGQYFIGELSFANEAAWEQFRRLTGLPAAGQVFRLELGKATRRGYGRVTARLEAAHDKESVWVRAPLAQRVADPSALTMTLLTDTIVTDVWGRYQLSFAADWLRQELGLMVDPASLNVFAEERAVDGFNNHLGLPRWRDLALKAGAAVGFKLLDPPADWPARLAAAERAGVGLRRAEGFGRVAFNHPVYRQGQGIPSGDSIKVGALGLASASTHPLNREREFRAEWERVLALKQGWTREELNEFKQGWELCAGAEFGAVARWLHARHQELASRLRQADEESLQDLFTELKQIGEPEDELFKLIPDYGVGHKGKLLDLDGVEFVIVMLEKLRAQAATESECAIGITMLADKLAATAAPRKEGQN